MISVIIPLYNKERSIVTTIESVLSQTYKDWELIIVDDGSTDRSADVVRDFIRANDEMSRADALNDPLSLNDGKFRLIYQANAGVSAARNRGIMEAKGEYVVFLDGDDIWEMDFLKEMVRLIDDYPEKSIYGLGCEQIKRGEKPELKESYYRGESGWSYVTMAFTGSSACVNKKDAIDVGLFDTRMTHGEDLDMWWRLMLLHGGASYLRPYAYYIQDAENRAMHRLAPLQKHIPYYVDKFAEARSTNPAFRKFYDEEMARRLYPYLFSKQYRSVAKRLLKEMDWTQQKKSLYWRMQFPYLYKAYMDIKCKL